MASDLLSIAASGARTARGALDVTAQNIANASSEGYVRRSVRMEEVSASGGQLRSGDISLSGARISAIHRNADLFRQAEVRRTTSDVERATTELRGLENIESAIEQAGVYPAIVEFEASLQQLAVEPTNSSLRAEVLAEADTMARKFNIAADSLDAVAEGLRFDAGAAVDEANIIAAELGRVNLRLARAGEGSSDRATLLDQRDALLETLSGKVDVTASFSADGSVTVTTGAAGGSVFVQGGTSSTLSMTTAGDGTVSFAMNGNPVEPRSGSLAGAALALEQVGAAHDRLDALANSIADEVNTAQGAPPALFEGTTAHALAMVMENEASLSNDAGGLRQALETSGAAKTMNGLLFDISSQVAGRTITSEALESIASSARISLEQQAGVDLDTEAANLIRYQQAFQASGRAMQVASRIFDTLIGIG